MTTLAAALRRASKDLAVAGIPEAATDARILASAAANLSREEILREPEALLQPAALRRFREAVARRARREPVARIVGEREFRSLPFRLGPATLDPRPDSEAVVEAALERIADPARPRRVLDLGTGSGCLLLSLLHALPGAFGIGTDIDREACRVAASNAEAIGVSSRALFVAGHWARHIASQFDVVVSNPPYVPSDEIENLAPEVRDHEPRAAIDGGADGLEAYRAVAPEVGRRLSADGFCVMEIGPDQAAAVTAIFAAAGLEARKTRRDLAGRPRALLFDAASDARRESCGVI